jgi:hypothetical protein
MRRLIAAWLCLSCLIACRKTPVDQVQIAEGLIFYFENGVVRSVHVCPPRLNFNQSETSVEVEGQCQIPSDQIIPGVGARGVALGWSEEKVMSVLANYKPVRQEWSPNACLKRDAFPHFGPSDVNVKYAASYHALFLCIVACIGESSMKGS